MSKGGNAPGMSKLAGVMRDLAKDQIPKELILDFGVIQEDKSLLTNSVNIPIPVTDYMVCRHLQRQMETSATKTSYGDYELKIRTQTPLKIGDHVLVAWINNDAVVIDVVLDASSIL